MGVDLFFVLSGFLITRILVANRELPARQYFAAFYERRVRRILPPYLLLMIVTSLLFGTAWVKTWYMYIGAMNYPRVGPSTLSILWSLAVEEQFYLVWPFVILFFARKRLPYFAIALIIVAPILRGVCTPLFQDHWAIYKQTPFRMDCLAVGALIGLLWEDRKQQISRIGTLWLVPGALGFGALFYLSRLPWFGKTVYTVKGNVIIYELTLVVVTSVMLWALSDKWTRALKLPAVRWIGRVSYSLYLIHLTVFTLLNDHLHGRVVVTLCAAGVSFAYAAASWYLLERPILSMKKKSNAPTLSNSSLAPAERT